MQVNVQAAETQLLKLIDVARAGEEVVILESGTPVAKIVALRESQRRQFKFGILEGKLTGPGPDFFEPMDEEELALWEGRD